MCGRAHPTWGSKKILWTLDRERPHEDWPARSTVDEILRRAGAVEPRGREGQAYAILIDIDDSPIHLLDEAHAGFYSVAGLQAARRHLRPGGVFALWTSLPEEPEVTDRLRQAFGDASAEEVQFDNALLDAPEVNAIYFARA